MPGVDLLDGIVSLWNALVNGDEKTTYRVYFPMCAIVALQLQAGLDGFLAIEKFILKHRGYLKTKCVGRLTLGILTLKLLLKY